ncbi:MAG: aldehyde dehydrogenase family protein [Campylobacterales bacterium]|nr:aldehyde dehydrogenase family protein [Campylobacterales bacterium]
MVLPLKAKLFLGSLIKEKKDYKKRRNPFNQKTVSLVPECTIEDAKEALLVAQDAFKGAKDTPLHQRIAWLEDVASKLMERKEEFAQMITHEVAKPISFSRIEASRCAETIKLTAMALANLGGETIPSDIMPSGKKTLSFYKRVPAGVAVCITPFNFPLNLITHKIAPALGAGCAVVLKPTPEASGCASMLAELFINSPYAIPDALSVVYGDADVGSALVSSPIPRVISFTGSVQVGTAITKNAGIKKLALELGGNAATYIDKSADITKAAQKCAFGAFYNSGQVCISLQRIYVHQDIYDDFASLIAKESMKLKVGNPYDDDTFMGPLINDDAKKRALSWVESAQSEGAKAICGGSLVDDFFPPTIMADVTDDMNIICEEVFAPIVSLIKVQSYEEAIEKINDSPYGLQFSIFTQELSLAQRFIDDAEAGGVVINEIPTHRFDVQPYGGVKLSGIGKEGPRWALEEFSEIKSISFY